MVYRLKDASPQLADVYDTRPVSEARSDIGTLTDQVAYNHNRVILTKQNKPVAALVPIADLEVLHALDAEQFQAMQAARKGAERESTIPLKTAGQLPVEPPPKGLGHYLHAAQRGINDQVARYFGNEKKPNYYPAVAGTYVTGLDPLKGMTVQDMIVGAYAPAVIATVENTIIDGVASKISGVLSSTDSPSAVREAVAEAVRESFCQPASPTSAKTG